MSEVERKQNYEALEALIADNSQGFFSVLRAFGIDRELTPETLVIASVRYGDPFVDALDRVINRESFSGAGLLALINTGIQAMTVAKDYSKSSEANEEQEREEEKKILGIPQKIFNLGILMLSLVSLLIALKIFKK